MAERPVQVMKYLLAPTSLVPNSPLPLLHYPGLLLPDARQAVTDLGEASVQNEDDVNTVPPSASATNIAHRAYTLLSRNQWQTQWIYRYGPTQASHYHSRVHECMIVLCGTARIRFGLEDHGVDDDIKSDQTDESQNSDNKALLIDAQPGDVFILPAGTAHKTFDTIPERPFALLTPGHGHGITVGNNPTKMDQTDKPGIPVEQIANDEQALAALSQIEFSGFAMLGAYPMSSSQDWDFATGGEYFGRYEEVWNTPIPERDPILGNSIEGLCSTWR